MKDHPSTRTAEYIGILLVFISIFLAYMNTFQVSWQLDDYPNILNNPNIHLTDLTYHAIKKTAYTSFEERTSLYRPVSCLTFALNWYFGKNSVQGFHGVNILFHFFTASILFLTILKLFKTPLLKNKYPHHQFSIALFSALLWALNPIQTQAVTYIVQRMTVLAAMFSILGIYVYVKARLMKVSFQQIFLFLVCFLSFLLALGSKENAAMMPLSLILIEMGFFQTFPLSKKIRKYFLLSILAGMLLLLAALLIFMDADGLLFFLKGYEHRPFTLIQRVMTCPRIIFFYLGQIFYPLPGQFSIAHDIRVSTALFHPWTTLLSFFGLFILIVTSFLLLPKYKLLAFAILFFLLNHIIESTLLPLELIFEHRNYLPSLFLFLPISVYLISRITQYHQKNYLLFVLFTVFTIFLVSSFGTFTYIRNSVWLTQESLWKDAMKKYPGLAAPCQKIAGVYRNQNKLDAAEKLYLKSLSLKAQRPKQSIVLALNNLGNIYCQKQEYAKAIEFYTAALKIYPENEGAIYNMVLALIRQKNWDMALESVDRLLSKNSHSWQYNNIKGFILLKQTRYTDALIYLRKALHIAPFCSSVKINLAAALSLTGHFDRAEWFLKRAVTDASNEILIVFSLIENSIRSKDAIKTDLYLKKLFQLFPVKNIARKLDALSYDDTNTPLSIKLIRPVIEKKKHHLSEESLTENPIKLLD